jgi:hypothetical protein
MGNRFAGVSFPKANKKADVEEHPEVFHHVGLLVKRASQQWVALHLVIRRQPVIITPPPSDTRGKPS